MTIPRDEQSWLLSGAPIPIRPLDRFLSSPIARITSIRKHEHGIDILRLLITATQNGQTPITALSDAAANPHLPTRTRTTCARLHQLLNHGLTLSHALNKFPGTFGPNTGDLLHSYLTVVPFPQALEGTVQTVLLQRNRLKERADRNKYTSIAALFSLLAAVTAALLESSVPSTWSGTVALITQLAGGFVVVAALAGRGLPYAADAVPQVAKVTDARARAYELKSRLHLLSTLIQHGTTVPVALHHVAETCATTLKDAFNHAAASARTPGTSLAQALGTTPLLAPLAPLVENSTPVQLTKLLHREAQRPVRVLNRNYLRIPVILSAVAWIGALLLIWQVPN